MKHKGIVVLLTTFVLSAGIVYALIVTQAWWHRETAKGHHLSIAPLRNWGFYSSQSMTLVTCLPIGRKCNTLYEEHEYGPIYDWSEKEVN